MKYFRSHLAIAALFFLSIPAHANGMCKADSLSCLNKPVGASCAGTGACFATKRLFTGDYACDCRTAHGGGICKGGSSAFCLNKAPGDSCFGTGTCLPTGNDLGGDFICECN